jgi:FkbM family methyltransferase
MNCFGPTCGILARRLTLRSEIIGDFREIELHGVDGTLFVDKRIPISAIKQAIAEQCYSWQWHYYQVPETAVSEDDVVFDCGCAEGIFPFLVKRCAARVVCFEPLPEFVIGLKKTFSKWPNIQIVEAALGEKSGEAYLREAGIMSTVSSIPSGIPVKITTIDQYCAETGLRMSYLKADVEGYEIPL